MPFLHLTPGTVVVIRRERWRIAAVTETGDHARIDATRLGRRTPAHATFFTPFDDINARHARHRPRRVRRQRWHAALDGARAQAEHVDLPLAALTADISILPYQLEPLLAMRGGERRVLIADAVGLGKTIQAGLIVAELLRRREAARVLIAAPSHLCPQWRDELRARFHLAPHIADAATIAARAAGLPRDVHPWSTCDVWISSLDFLKQPHVLHALPPDPWDLVVIDEAHMITGHSERRAAAQAITRSTRRVLLLTATPLSGLDDGRVLMRMGALTTHERLTVFRRTRADIGMPSRRRQRQVRVTPSAAEQHAFDLIDAFARAALATASGSTVDATRLLVSVLAKRALSTPAALAISAGRRLAHLSSAPDRTCSHLPPDRTDSHLPPDRTRSHLPLDRTGSHLPTDAIQTSLDFGDADDDALTVAIGMSADHERAWMRRLCAAATTAAIGSRKISRLLTLLSRTRESVIVFTEFRDSLDAIAAALRRHRYGCVIAHGGLSPAELQEALDAFRRGDARILLATDVASQGLNLHQCARWVIHADLPWNPIRLEQRAGRVDRLGQTRDVHVTQLVLTHARDLAFADQLSLRADAAAQSRALTNATRWQRRARAAATVLLRRRQQARAWQGPVMRGRPLSTKGGTEIWEHDIEGIETLVQGSAALEGSRQRVMARARRVARMLAIRARRAAAVERLLRARLADGEAQPSLPGALAADALRHVGQRAAAIAAARAACDQHIATLDRCAAAPPLTITARQRFTGH